MNIVHRDIKLDNLMFLNENDLESLVLIDWGLSKYVFDKIQGEIGTKHFIAPEAYNGQYYTTKFDMFSAGVVLFIMISGKFPFTASASLSI